MTQIVVFKVVGLSDILMNNPTSMDEPDSPGLRTKKIAAEQEAERKLYVTKDGELYIPSVAFLRSLWQGASYQKIGKDSARARIQAGVFAVEDRVILLDKDTQKPITDYSIDSRTVVIKATKGRVMRHRPKISNWMCLLPLEVDSDYIGTDNIIPIFNRAGRMVGVMDFRPEKTGPFGRYKVSLNGGVERTREYK